MGERIIKSKLSEQIPYEIRSRGVAVAKVDHLHHIDRLSQQQPLTITMSLCPLYIGSLLEGRLAVTYGFSPSEVVAMSRVAQKWDQGIQAIEGIFDASALWRPNGAINLKFTFADAAVILGHTNPENLEILERQKQVYETLARQRFEDRMKVSVDQYSRIDPNYPRLISANADEYCAVMDEAIDQLGMETTSIRSRKIVGNLMAQLGDRNNQERRYNVGMARVLISQYSVFDALTTQPDALNIFTERESMGTLLRLTDLFSHSVHPRLDILC